jgi:hypothetical protein
VELEVPINAAQQMRLRDVIVKVGGVKEFVLPATLTTHHSDALLSLDESRIGNPPEFCGVFQQNRPN